jgi:hypothetical protein
VRAERLGREVAIGCAGVGAGVGSGASVNNYSVSISLSDGAAGWLGHVSAVCEGSVFPPCFCAVWFDGISPPASAPSAPLGSMAAD